VTIEPCGKDLATAGGSRDRADAIARRVFEREPPLRVDYEFLNIRGQKMSTSRGRGAAAHQIAEVLPAEQLRLLFLRPRPNQAIEFDPQDTDAIPRLFDEFDRLAAALAGRSFRGELPPDYERLFAMSLPAGTDVAKEAQAFRPPFAHLAFLLQVPGVDLGEKVAAEKGEPLTDRERAILEERVSAARVWLDDYAPERARVAVQDELPPTSEDLDAEQRTFLVALAERLTAAATPWTGDGLQSAVFDIARERNLPPAQAFAALYAAFLGRSNGPRAGWLLASLAPDFVRERLRAAGRAG